uniref:Guanylate kinase-like domain-containing protein n=1 Tax=Caenorhabditis japonica TaxID=281687 RepID=A0A8R1E103_CAEJA
MTDDDELTQLRSNADNLSRCLHVLLEKIEKIEQKNGKEPQDSDSNKSSTSNTRGAKPNGNEKEKYEQVDIEEKTEIDPKSGLKKKTIVTERVLTTKTFHALTLDGPSPTMTPILRSSSGSAKPTPQYESRKTIIDAEQLSRVDVEKHGGRHLVVTRVHDETVNLKPGDVITHVDGKDVFFRADIENLTGQIELTLEPAPIHSAPPRFFRVQDVFSGELEVSPGDVIQVLSKDEEWMQVRKLADLTQVGRLPTRLPMEKVSMMCPFGRRCLVLLGAVGTGRRDIKSMLLRLAPNYFSTVVPLTSRGQRPGEVEGRDYNYLRKEDMYQKIREGGMVEWGELDDQLYGTSADSVRTEIRSGRMCVLDAAPKSVNYLYNAEFMPFVVHIVPPPLEEFRQLEAVRRTHRTEAQLQLICDESAKISDECKSKIHLTLVNRNIDVTFKRFGWL